MLEEILSNPLTEGLFYLNMLLIVVIAFFLIRYKIECTSTKRNLHKKAVGNGKTSKYA